MQNDLAIESIPVMLHPHPQSFRLHQFRKTYKVFHSHEAIWDWLNDTKTFTQGQTWPYRVEFVAPEQNEKATFETGVFTTHHGPLMNFAGILAAIDAPHYRDLRYLYGSYFLTLRWLRPTRLQFWLEDKQDHVEVTVQLDTFVKTWLFDLWTRTMNIFWGRFGRWMNRAVRKHKMT